MSSAVVDREGLPRRSCHFPEDRKILPPAPADCRFRAAPVDQSMSAAVNDDGEEIMNAYLEHQGDIPMTAERLIARKNVGVPLPTAVLLRAVESRPSPWQNHADDHDFSEEAIPERDPAYHLPDGTGYTEPTVEAMPPEVSLDLARRLQQLGMSQARAALVVSLH
jgi:hypothetical protein